jgi:rare lipoprotein A (peptidoglycan hydrolase)
MRNPFLKISIAAVLAASACAGYAASDALAATGGALSAPTPLVSKASLATWFGPGFYGQTTACGQTLTPAVVGVANRTLPCGTLVKFKYKGRTATIPVIDRGPYANNGAQWDLTFSAASELGVPDTARLGSRVVGSVPNTPTLGLPLGAAQEAANLAGTGGAAAAP